jgi:hypothetical protein
MYDDDDSEGFGPGYLIGSAAIGRELGLKERRARYWLQAGIIPAIKAGKTWMIHKADLDARFRIATVPVSAQTY